MGVPHEDFRLLYMNSAAAKLHFSATTYAFQSMQELP